MSINETNLRITSNRDIQLQTKLKDARKRRDGISDKILRVSKKRNMTKSDLQRLGRYNKDLVNYEKDITQLIDQIKKNTVNLNKYKEKVAKEQERQMKSILKSMESQSIANDEYLDNYSEMSKNLNELSSDVKHSVQEKELIEYDVFLSHSSLDKEIFVSELSEELSAKGLKVFEDVKVFKMGHSQTDMMNVGILNSRFVVVCLSSNFIKSGWSDYEFKSFLNREINEKRVIILPIWHEVSTEEVRKYNPYLVDKFALSTEKFSLQEIAEHITQLVLDSMDN